MKSALLVLLFLLGCQRLQAQLPQYHAQVFGAEQGIAAGSISSVFKDQKQFLWIVEGNVLQRFDGRNTLSHQFESHIVQAVCDWGNRVWVLEGKNLRRSRPGQRDFETVPLDTAAGHPCAIFQLRQRPFCLLTKKGFFNWDEKTSTFQQWQTALPPAHFAPGGNRFDTCGTTIFYPGKDCFHAADLATGQVRTLPTSTRFPTFCALTPDLAAISYFDGVSVWLDFKKGTVTRTDARRYGLNRQLANLNIMDAVPLGDSVFLVTTKFGACTYDLRSDRFARQRIFAGGRPIELEEALLRLFLDENGTFWAHNNTHVVSFNSLNNSIGLLRNYHDEPPLRWSNRVVGFTEDGEGNVWFGGFNGFNKLDLATGQVETHAPAEGDPARLSHQSIRGLAFDGRTLLLGPTLRGMWLYDPQADRYSRPAWSDAVQEAMQQEFVNGILPLRDGNFLVCGAPRQYRLEAGTRCLEMLAFSDKTFSVTGACQDVGGRIWLAGGEEVFALDEKCRLLFSIPVGKAQAKSIFFCGNDTLLVGTEKGLRLLAPASAHGILQQAGSPLEGRAVYQIGRDRRGRFWFGTADGLFLADAALKVFRRFDFADNIQSRFFNPFSMFRASNGLLLLGGYNGINFFYPENIELETMPLSVSLEMLTLGEQDSIILCSQSGLVFSHRQNTLTLEVTAPYYNNAGKLQYRYRLGASGQWISTNGSNLVRLANLPPGTHRLEVAASVTGAVWYVAAPLCFQIKPPFWRTPLFLVVAAVVVACLLWLFIGYRESVLKKRQQQALELERLKSTALQFEVEAAAAKLQSLRLQMNPHFLFNALNSIQELILTGSNDGAASYLSKFSKLLRKVLAHSDQEWVSLGEEIAMLKLYLELEALRFCGTFEYQIECSPGLDPGQYKVPTLLIQPFVENAIWHGLLHKQGKRCLRLQFEAEGDDNLLCTVEDNGVGRKAALQNTAAERHTGKGTSAAQQRLEVLNSRYSQFNSLKIIDLFEFDGSPAGTKVRIKLC